MKKDALCSVHTGYNLNDKNRKVVLKLVDVMDCKKETQDRQKRSYKICQGLAFPFIIRVEDISEGKNKIIAVFEYSSQGTLKDYLNKFNGKEKPLDEETILDFLTQLSLGLDYIHYKHVVHKNLKTDSIYLFKHDSGKHILKIGSFQNATVLERTLALTLQVSQPVRFQEPTFHGDAKERINERSDVYPLGVILYEMCTGEVNDQSRLNVDDAIEKLSRLGYSQELIDILEKLLEPSIDNRKSIHEIIRMEDLLHNSVLKKINSLEFKDAYKECFDFKFRSISAIDNKKGYDEYSKKEESMKKEYMKLVNSA